MSDLVGNPEDRFSHNEAHVIFDGFVMQSQYCLFLVNITDKVLYIFDDN